MKLDVPELMQEKGSSNCQALCVQMLLHYYDDPASMDEIMEGLKPFIIGDTGMHSQGPAIWLTQRGYDVTYVAHDLEVIDKDIEHVHEQDVDRLKQKLSELTNDPDDYRHKKIELDIQLIESGTKYSNDIPNLELFDELLKHDVPIKIGVQARGLRANPRRDNNHSVVVIGKEGEDYILNDPNPFNGPSYAINQNQLLMAWYLNSARTMIVKRAS